MQDMTNWIAYAHVLVTLATSLTIFNIEIDIPNCTQTIVMNEML